MFGLGGDDRLMGGKGEDFLYGGDDNDLLSGGKGTEGTEGNHLYGERGNDKLISDATGDVLNGGEDSDYLLLTANSVGAEIIPGTGNDVIDATDGKYYSVIFGPGDGHDMIIGDQFIGMGNVSMPNVSKSQLMVVFGTNRTYFETETLDLFDDFMVREHYYVDVALVITATGDSIVIRGTGVKTTNTHKRTGEVTTNDQEYYPHSGWVYLSDGPLTMSDMFDNGVDAVTVKFIVGDTTKYKVALDEYQRAVSSSGGSKVNGAEGNDFLSGGNGDDLILAAGGDDRIEASSGTDKIDGGAGRDTIVFTGRPADYRFMRQVDGSVIAVDPSGVEGTSILVDVEDGYFAGTGQTLQLDSLFAIHGTDADDPDISGTESNDEIYGWYGSDTLNGRSGDDVLDGGSGDDLVYGGEGNDRAYGDDGDDFIGGDDGNDYLEGGAGRDAISGDGGDDDLNGGAGSDLLDGGAGADRLLFFAVPESTSVDHDRLVGFNPADGDRIDLPVTIGNMNVAVNGGTLSWDSFDADLCAALGADKLSAGNAVLFTADAGDFTGLLFIVADANGVAGYQAGEDYVFLLETPPPMEVIDAGLFI